MREEIYTFYWALERVDNSMITSKADYKEYYIADLQATGLNVKPNLIVYLKDKRYRFYKMLRKAEYYTNCGKEIPGGVFGASLSV